jgi:hypothetical protein
MKNTLIRDERAKGKVNILRCILAPGDELKLSISERNLAFLGIRGTARIQLGLNAPACSLRKAEKEIDLIL